MIVINSPGHTNKTPLFTLLVLVKSGVPAED